MSGLLTPQEVAETVIGNCCKKASQRVLPMIVLGILAGAYIAFGAELCTMATHDLAKHAGLGVAKLVGGGVFSVGLMLVVIAGGELFTGNCLILGATLKCRVSPGSMLKNWFFVYTSNFVGSLLVVAIMYYGGLWKLSDMGVGAAALKTAVAKTDLTFTEAFFRGIGCNWLVCLAVWMAVASKDVTGKILGIFFPVMAFVASSFEHSIANMYFIPMGMLLKNHADVVSVAALHNGAANLNWTGFLVGNLVPVTLGNIVGGAIFVAGAYYLAYARPSSVLSEMQCEEVASIK